MSYGNSIYNDWHRLRHEHNTLIKALPKLPEPEELLRKIVQCCRDVMFYSAILDQLHGDIPIVSQSQQRWGELERDAQILECRAENCELRFLNLRQTLRTLYAAVPLLIATSKMSKDAWRSMVDMPQSYYDAEGRKHKLPVAHDIMETIIADQLSAVQDFLAALRNMRTTLLNEERAQRDTMQQKLEQSISSMQQTIAELSGKIDSVSSLCQDVKSIATSVAELQKRADDSREPVEPDGASMEVVEPELTDEEKETLHFTRRSLLARIHVLEIRIGNLQREQPCKPRLFQAGFTKDEAARMRCAFCGTRGKHYSDQCLRVRDSTRRRIRLRDRARCRMCLEIACNSDADSCPNYWIMCFHCERMGHHSAICDWPDRAQELQEEIDDASREIVASKKKISVINRKLGLQDDV
ncbi:unnamed protein product [Heligmosomoides polygyrus]|uniref:CCHC-type domain-containing protein n=1 Tax=Heligmosomoides polygyrus TaxID=6339 RepID=A0A183FGL3_HELPZ|nr:unnamed protein product [Heligmosomoides polygyrus]